MNNAGVNPRIIYSLSSVSSVPLHAQMQPPRDRSPVVFTIEKVSANEWTPVVQTLLFKGPLHYFFSF